MQKQPLPLTTGETVAFVLCRLTRRQEPLSRVFVRELKLRNQILQYSRLTAHFLRRCRALLRRRAVLLNYL